MKTLAHFLFAAFLCVSAIRGAGAQETGGAVVYASGKTPSFDAMLDELSKADVVFVGENHDHKRGHALELAILKGLAERNPNLALGMEMFERDTQNVLDEYLGGYVTESAFLQAARPWPNYKTDYAPLVNFCRERKIPVLATNAPRRYVNIVSRVGQAALLALPKPSRAFLPPLPYSMTLPPEYDRQLTEIFSGGHDTKDAAAAAAMPSAERMKQAQGLWDATMADSLAAFRRRSRRTVLHVNGAMHSDGGYGIADRLRHWNPRLRVKIVTIRPASHYPDLPAELPANAADFVIVTPEDLPVAEKKE